MKKWLICCSEAGNGMSFLRMWLEYGVVTAAIIVLLPFAAMAEGNLPVEGGVVTSKVGLRLDPFGSGRLVYHRGIDIAVPVGTPVRAVRPGVVSVAGNHGAYGIAVILRHDDGSRTLYGHNSLARVQVGETVEAGTVIALSGNSGRSTGPHVHFEELTNDRFTAVAARVVTVVEEPARNVVDDTRLAHEQKLEAAVQSVLRSINRLPQQPELTGQGGL